MEPDIVLPSGLRVAAKPGRYRVTPPPDLEAAAETERRFLLEYNHPILIVRDLAISALSNTEQMNAVYQVYEWRRNHPEIGGHVSSDRSGYRFGPTSRTSRHCQLIPNVAFVDQITWARASDRDAYYAPCVPVFVIELMTDKGVTMEDLQDKVAKFIDAGTQQALIVDTRGDRMWIHNRNEQPHFAALGPVKFVAMPGFTFDCIAIRDARIDAEI